LYIYSSKEIKKCDHDHILTSKTIASN